MSVVGGRVNLLGVEIDGLTEADAIASVMDGLDSGEGGWLVTANLDQLRCLAADSDLRDLMSSASLVVPDGMPLVWASRLKGDPLPERVAGSDMTWSLTAEAALRGRRVYLLGGSPGTCEAAEQTLRDNYPGVAVAGCYSPPFGFESCPDELSAIRHKLAAADPDIVYVALGFPKQERLIASLREEFPRAWFVGVGVSFSFLGGQVARAPEWMSRLGLEWIHRLVQEPRRLARRYLVDGIPFAARLLSYAVACRLRRRELVPATVQRQLVSVSGGQRVVFGRGTIERRRADALRELLQR